jgi:hypothetical protein
VFDNINWYKQDNISNDLNSSASDIVKGVNMCNNNDYPSNNSQNIPNINIIPIQVLRVLKGLVWLVST